MTNKALEQFTELWPRMTFGMKLRACWLVYSFLIGDWLLGLAIKGLLLVKPRGYQPEGGHHAK